MASERDEDREREKRRMNQRVTEALGDRAMCFDELLRAIPDEPMNAIGGALVRLQLAGVTKWRSELGGFCLAVDAEPALAPVAKESAPELEVEYAEDPF